MKVKPVVDTSFSKCVRVNWTGLGSQKGEKGVCCES